jgi:hypothetical protein
MVRVLLGSSLMQLLIFLCLSLIMQELSELSELSSALSLIQGFDFCPILILELHDEGPIIRLMRDNLWGFNRERGELGS